MLIGSFAFANNFEPNVSSEINQETETFTQTDVLESPAGTCYITIKGYDKEGELMFTVTLVIVDVESEEECSQIADNLRN